MSIRLFIAIALLVSFSPAEAKPRKTKPAKPEPAPNALDGKSFLGALSEYGANSKGREEMFVFRDGKFTCTLASAHSFGAIPYFCIKRGDGSFLFTGEALNPRVGNFHWDVVVYGTRLDGVATWSESGDKVHTYGVHALLLAPAGAPKK